MSQQRAWSLLSQRLRFATALSASPWDRAARTEISRFWSQSDLTRQSGRLEQLFAQALVDHPDVVFISTYLMYRDIVERLCATCAQQAIPTLVGGPYFTEPKVREFWRNIPGLTAIFFFGGGGGGGKGGPTWESGPAGRSPYRRSQ